MSIKELKIVWQKIKDKEIKVHYKNWQGEVAWRNIIPKKYYYGSTEWHPKKGWLLEVFDVGKYAQRTYSVKDIIQLIPPVYEPK